MVSFSEWLAKRHQEKTFKRLSVALVRHKRDWRRLDINDGDEYVANVQALETLEAKHNDDQHVHRD